MKFPCFILLVLFLTVDKIRADSCSISIPYRELIAAPADFISLENCDGDFTEADLEISFLCNDCDLDIYVLTTQNLNNYRQAADFTSLWDRSLIDANQTDITATIKGPINDQVNVIIVCSNFFESCDFNNTVITLGTLNPVEDKILYWIRYFVTAWWTWVPFAFVIGMILAGFLSVFGYPFIVARMIINKFLVFKVRTDAGIRKNTIWQSSNLPLIVSGSVYFFNLLISWGSAIIIFVSLYALPWYYASDSDSNEITLYFDRMIISGTLFGIDLQGVVYYSSLEGITSDNSEYLVSIPPMITGFLTTSAVVLIICGALPLLIIPVQYIFRNYPKSIYQWISVNILLKFVIMSLGFAFTLIVASSTNLIILINILSCKPNSFLFCSSIIQDNSEGTQYPLAGSILILLITALLFLYLFCCIFIYFSTWVNTYDLNNDPHINTDNGSGEELLVNEDGED